LKIKIVDMATSSEMIDQLKATLSRGAVVVTPDSDNYAECQKRWSVAAEKNAVSLKLLHLYYQNQIPHCGRL
jgi:homoserine dehydrogenase